MSNFKAVATGEVAPARLTVVAGANSSGKSSLLQALLFFAQSFGEPSAVINGDLVRLGEPLDVIRKGTEEMTLEVAYPVALPETEGEEPQFGEQALRVALTASRDVLVPSELAVWRAGELQLLARRSEPPPGVELLDWETLLAIDNASGVGLPDGALVGMAGITPQRVIYQVSDEWVEEGFERLVEMASGGRLSAIDELFGLVASRAAQEPEPAPGLVRVFDKLRDLRFDRATEGRRRSLTKRERTLLLPLYREAEAPGGWASEPIGRHMARSSFRTSFAASLGGGGSMAPVELTLDRMSTLATSVRYLGPLREDPRVAYPLGHAVQNLPVGEKGQFTAAFLERGRLLKQPYVDPNGQRREHETLLNAVTRWCQYLQIGQEVSVRSRGKLGFELKLTLHGEPRDMTAIGVGASQLLPVVALVLGAPPNTLILLEQPELHLHPAVQSRLANFFALARPDVRLVVETHSEYLVTRLRRLVAEGDVPRQHLAVLFAEQEDGVTRVERIAFTEASDVDRWPKGFFDTLDSEFADLARAVRDRHVAPGTSP